MDKLILKPINDLPIKKLFAFYRKQGYRWKKRTSSFGGVWNFRLK
jgi:hypothetical protein